MIRRFKAFCILGVALLALLGLSFRAGAATTYSVNIDSAQFIPSFFTFNLTVGDSVTFRISGQGVHNVSVNGTTIGAGLVSGNEVSYLFNTDGTFTVNDTFRGSSMSITVVQPVNAAPTVSLTLPVDHASIMVTNATTNITIRAHAEDTDGPSPGSVRRVDFLYGVGTSVASLTNVINTITNGADTNNTFFEVTWTNATPGRYLLQARAHDNLEVFAGSVRFVLNLYTPFTNTLPVLTNSTQYVFTHTADTNLVYISDKSTNLIDWIPFTTNVATNNVMQVLDPNTNNFTNLFYRVRLLP